MPPGAARRGRPVTAQVTTTRPIPTHSEDPAMPARRFATARAVAGLLALAAIGALTTRRTPSTLAGHERCDCPAHRWHHGVPGERRLDDARECGQR